MIARQERREARIAERETPGQGIDLYRQWAEEELSDSEGEETVSLDEMRDMEFRDNGYKWEDWN